MVRVGAATAVIHFNYADVSAMIRFQFCIDVSPPDFATLYPGYTSYELLRFPLNFRFPHYPPPLDDFRLNERSKFLRARSDCDVA